LIIIPCYNEQDNVSLLYEQLIKIQIDNCAITPLFINDYSSDNTRVTLEKIGATFLDNPINLGIGGTVQLGFMYAYDNGFEYAAQMDGDGQHPPSELLKVISPIINNEADVVIGSRFIDKEGFQSSTLRRFGIDFFSSLNKFLVGVSIKDSTSGFRAYNRKAISELINYYPDEYPEPEAIVYLAHKGLKIKEVSVLMAERVAGVSSIRRFSSIYYMIKVTLNTLFLHLKMKSNG
ncbi:MAG: glycosyltransferase family 2 protein, partial [Bacteroidota bacterium]